MRVKLREGLRYKNVTRTKAGNSGRLRTGYAKIMGGLAGKKKARKAR